MQELLIAAGRLAVLAVALDEMPYVNSMRHSSIVKYTEGRPQNLRKIRRWAADYKLYITGESDIFPNPDFNFAGVDLYADECLMRQMQKLDSSDPKTNMKRLYSYFYNRGVPFRAHQIQDILVHLVETRDLVHPIPTAEYSQPGADQAEAEEFDQPPVPYRAEADRVVGVSHAACFTLGDHTLVPVRPTAIAITHVGILAQAAPLTQALAASPTPGSYYIVPTAALSVIYGTVLVTGIPDLARAPVMTI